MNALNKLKRKAKDNKRKQEKIKKFQQSIADFKSIYPKLTDKEKQEHNKIFMDGIVTRHGEQVIMSAKGWKEMKEYEDKMITKYKK